MTESPLVYAEDTLVPPRIGSTVDHDDHTDRRLCQAIGCHYGDH